MALVALDGFSVTNSCAWHWGVTCLKLGSFQGGVRFFLYQRLHRNAW
jgi:hypothetical protein